MDINGTGRIPWSTIDRCNRNRVYTLVERSHSARRISKKKEKPRPRTFLKFGKQNSEIKNYLQFKKCLRPLL